MGVMVSGMGKSIKLLLKIVIKQFFSREFIIYYRLSYKNKLLIITQIKNFNVFFLFRYKNMENMKTIEFTTLQELQWNLFSYVPDLKAVAKKPAVENPFISNLKLTNWDKIKTAFLCFLVPFRMLLLGSTLFVACIIGKLFLIGYKESNSTSSTKRYPKNRTRFNLRFLSSVYVLVWVSSC